MLLKKTQPESLSVLHDLRPGLLAENWGRTEEGEEGTAFWSLQIVGRGLHQERSRNFKGIKDSTTPKRFYSPFL